MLAAVDRRRVPSGRADRGRSGEAMSVVLVAAGSTAARPSSAGSRPSTEGPASEADKEPTGRPFGTPHSSFRIPGVSFRHLLDRQRVEVVEEGPGGGRRRTSGRSPRCTGRSDRGVARSNVFELNSGWLQRGRPQMAISPNSPVSAVVSTIISNVIGMNDGQLKYGRPPMFSG